MKTCSTCKQEKESTEFYKDKSKKDQLCYRCKDCQKASHKARYIPKPRKVSQWTDRDRQLWRRYKMRVSDYDALLEKQNNCCLMCRRDQSEFNFNLCVDHDHNCCPGRDCCGKCVRGLLCMRCNSFLGYINEDPEALSRGIAIIQHFEK